VSGVSQLQKGLERGLSQVPNPDAATRAATARTIADPVEIRNVAQTSAGSYGAGLAPFFVSLAAWIGGYVLFLLVRPLSNRAMAANQTPLRVALGGWLAPSVLGAAQVLFLIALLAFGLRIVPSHLVLTPLFLVLVSLTFVAIVQALNAWLGTAGQFIALVLMLVQLVSAGGTFPWQTIPTSLYGLHHVLPMSYSVDGLRHLLYGGEMSSVATDVTVLVAWLAGSLLLSSLAARRFRVWSVSRIKPELVL
jgi:putative membrane protein